MKTEEITEEYSEKLVPLTQDEIELLKKKRWQSVLGIALFSVVWYGVLYFITGGALEGFFTIFIAIFALAPFVILGMILWNAKRDIDFGQKQLIRGRLDSKREETRTSGSGKNRSTSTYYFFALSGREIAVQLKHYNEFQTGDIIEIEKMPKSGDILKMRELRSNLVREGEKPVFKSDFEKKNKEFFKETRIADTIPLSMDEEALLKKLRNKRALTTLVVGGIVGVISYYVLFFGLAIGTLLLHQAYPDFFTTLFGGYPGKSLHYGVIAFVAGIVVLILYKRVGGLQRDLSEGRKEIVKTTVEDKLRSNVKVLSKNVRITSSRGDFYYAVIDGKYYTISPDEFLKIECGSPVKMHLAPHSKTLLKIEGI
jgi:hypothetical protein